MIYIRVVYIYITVDIHIYIYISIYMYMYVYIYSYIHMYLIRGLAYCISRARQELERTLLGPTQHPGPRTNRPELETLEQSDF